MLSCIEPLGRTLKRNNAIKITTSAKDLYLSINK